MTFNLFVAVAAPGLLFSGRKLNFSVLWAKYFSEKIDFEGRTLPECALFYENMAVVILLDNALGERESESPATLLGGKARLENRLEVAVGNAAPRVGEEDACATRMCLCRNRDAAAGFHSIDGILA